MDWPLTFSLLAGLAVGLMLLGFPVAVAFFGANIVGVFLFMGGEVGVRQIIANGSQAVSSFALIPVPLFLLMGALFFRSGLATRVLDALDICFGSIRARLSYVTVTCSAVFASLSGSSIATTGMMGSLMVPEMLKRGYKPHMAMGPVLGSGGLAVVIPPSALAVFLASLARIDVSGLLVAGLVPGLILALMYIGVIFLQARIDPEAAPAYRVERIPLWTKLGLLAREAIPITVIVFAVVGTMILGIATPTESAAMGCLAVVLLAAAYRALTLDALTRATDDALRVTVMTFLLIVSATTFSQILAYTGATSGLIGWATSFDLSREAMLFAMFGLLLFLGMFLDVMSMMLLTLPIFLPLVTSLEIDPMLFGIVVLIGLEVSFTTPPFGMLLFVMLGVAPKGTTLSMVARAALPYVCCSALLVALLITFPFLVNWLPRLMR